MIQEYRLLISGGGTGGHIYPALAIINAMQNKLGKNAKLTVKYIGSERGLEAEIVQREGFDFTAINVRGLVRRITLDNLLVVKEAVQAVVKCYQLVQEFKPDVVIGTGGFVCGPVLLAAALQRKPVLLQEQNAYPGLTNRLLSFFAKYIAVGYNEAGLYFQAATRSKVRYTGNPVYRLNVVEREADLYKKFSLSSEKRTVLITGGSRGARSLNNALLTVVNKFNDLERVQFVWITGQGEYERVLVEISIPVPDNVKVIAYSHDMAQLLAISDLVISRAGAMALAEFALNKLPAILIPYPYATADHQNYNAQTFAAVDAAVVISDKKLTGEKLLREIKKIIYHDTLRHSMAEHAGQLAKPRAADSVAELAYSLMEKSIVKNR